MKYLYRQANKTDISAIAAIHALSWKENYRGILSEQYLDHQVDLDRHNVWNKRLSHDDPNQIIILAEVNQEIIGFACAYEHYDSEGNYLDNLHVKKAFQGLGIGRQLMHQISIELTTRKNRAPLYLWVFEDNIKALAIYESWEGLIKETKHLDMPSGGGGGMATKILWKNHEILALSKNVDHSEKYQPISCDLYDHFEIAAMRKTPVIIHLKNGEKIDGIIKTMTTQNSVEYLKTTTGINIRLDHISMMTDHHGYIIVNLSTNTFC